MERQIDKHDRRTTVAPDYLKERKIYDIIYGYYQLHCYFDGQDSYCYKKDCTYAKIRAYFQSHSKEVPISVNTLTNINKLLLKSGLIEKGKKDGKVAYILPANSSNYVWIKYDTLKFLVATCRKDVIKAYAYLKNNYEIKKKQGKPFWFTKKQLLEVLGYKTNYTLNYENINFILDTLINNGLIEVHEQRYVGSGGTAIPNYILDRVNEDFIRNISKPCAPDRNIDVPIKLKEDKTETEYDFHF